MLLRNRLKKFANEAGVSVVNCGAGWGGRYAYTESGYPEFKVCGFKTKEEARRHWLVSAFGENTATALLKLLENQK